LERKEKIETKAVHAGEPTPRIEGSVAMPIFQSAMFETPGGEGYHNIRYIRLNNTPNAIAVQGKLASLEGADDALVTSSGMAAITSALLAFLSNGDHLLIQDCLYGGTHDFVTKDLETFGIAYDFIDGNNPSSWKSKLRKSTKVIYVETMSNPLLGIADLEAIVEFAGSNGLVSMIDNTFATPVNYRPIERGFDLSLHSATKYLNGHSDIVAGAVIGNKELVGKVKKRVDHLGGSLDPHACFLLHRGIKTLPLRMKQHNKSALEIANFLENRAEIRQVNYPGLDSHPQHDRAARIFEGFGGMLSFELNGGKDAATHLLRSVTIPIVAPSLGGVESLITIPAVTSHAGMSPEDRNRLGISDGLVRLSVGVEATEDLIDDIESALDELAQEKLVVNK
jgi:cystathionine beta-lyase/cystathionine gamma-synthase